MSRFIYPGIQQNHRQNPSAIGSYCTIEGFRKKGMTEARKTHVRVAVTQAEPVWLDLEATVEKTCGLIAEAAENGAEVVTFPECWIPGYPAWIW